MRVEDAGPGVPERLKHTVFEPFSQGDQAAASASPGRIGLARVAQFTERHGGSFRVDDRAGGGASFLITLPRTEERDTPDEGASLAVP